MNAKRVIGLGAFLATFAIAGAAAAHPSVTALPRGTVATCRLSAQPGAIIRDHRTDLGADCVLLIAEHNHGVLTASLGRLSGPAQLAAKAQASAWDRLRHNATFTLAHNEFEAAQTALTHATGSARAAAEQALEKAKGALHGAVENAERHGAEIAQEARTYLNEHLSAARAKAQEAKHAFEGAAAHAKEKLEGMYLKAEHAVKHLEEMFAQSDLNAAKQKFAAAMKRVGDGAAALKARAQQEWEHAQHAFNGVKDRVKNEVHAIETKVKHLEDKLKHKFEDLRHDLSHAADHIKDHINGAKEAITKEVGHLAHGLKDALSHLF